MRRRRVAGRTAGDGVSSRTFWWRRWIEQSRSPRWTPWPWPSNSTWTSTWRGPSTSRSRTSRSSPNAASGLASRGREALLERGRGPDDAHALAATARGGLDEHWQPDRGRLADEGRVVLVRAVVARDDRHAELRGEPARGGLVAHRPDRGRRRPDPADTGRDDRLGEGGVLGEEPEAGMERVGADRRRRPRRRRRSRGGRQRRARRSAGRSSRSRDGRRCAGSGRRSRRGSRRTASGWPAGAAIRRRAAASNAPIASFATRQRPPMRRAGSRPVAIQRWTVRVLVPIRRAASLALTSSDMRGAIVARVGSSSRGRRSWSST